MNRGQLVTRTARTLGIGLTGGDSTDDLTLLQDLANDAVVDVLSRTRVYVRCVDLQLTVDKREYEIAQTILRFYNAFRGATRLQEIVAGEQSHDDLSDSGTISVVGFNRIRIGWDPGSSLDTIELNYTPRPTLMSADGHDPATTTYGAIPAEFHPALVNYMCWHAADRVGDQGSGRGDKYKAWYEGPDGVAGPGTDLGKIKYAINVRMGSGSRRGRTRRSDYQTTGDSLPNLWIG